VRGIAVHDYTYSYTVGQKTNTYHFYVSTASTNTPVQFHMIGHDDLLVGIASSPPPQTISLSCPAHISVAREHVHLCAHDYTRAPSSAHIQGSHYDEYVLNFYSFRIVTAFNNTVFGPPPGLKCGDFPGPPMQCIGFWPTAR